MEQLRSSSESQFVSYEGSSAVTPHYLIDNFCANGWTNPENQVFFEGGENRINGAQTEASIADEYSIFTNFHYQAPKLEDFLGDSSSIVRFSDSQTETQDSSLTQIYEPQDLKEITGFQAFSTNSGSEVDDSSSMGGTQLARRQLPGHSIESRGNNSKNNTCKAIVTVDSYEPQDLKEITGFQAFSTNSGSEVDDSSSMGGTQLARRQLPGHSIESRGNNSKNNTCKAIVSVDSDSSKKISDTFGQRTSINRGVTRHRWTGRYEAHLWDNSCRREGQARKGRQGGYDKEEKAARAYDLASAKYWGPTATTNFSIANYWKELEEMKNVTKQEFIASIRRNSSGFSRGASIYRGVTRHHQQGRWQARIGRVAGNKDLYLATEEEAAVAYDIAAIKFRAANAVTNFEMSRYDVEAIAKSSLPIGGAAKRQKHSLESDQKPIVNHKVQQQLPRCSSNSHGISFAPMQPVSDIPCGIPFDAATATAVFYQQNLYHHIQSTNIGICESLRLSSTTAIPTIVMLQPAVEFLLPHRSY
ncbi:AP2-like ethylene-responsive transcription factor AIL7 [Hibiscus syriacus]|uniref:AP2-like ethylene-responsive transcription factor AIL7 n=1 Tax=Hibiscus syriacus TaxID=106335 RepID=A0A6A3AAT3_HIBSY|nr:AP2-like ethylene-responsive transcription factor AIL7 [Hibiscus syriacus]